MTFAHQQWRIREASVCQADQSDVTRLARCTQAARDLFIHLCNDLQATPRSHPDYRTPPADVLHGRHDLSADTGQCRMGAARGCRQTEDPGVSTRPGRPPGREHAGAASAPQGRLSGSRARLDVMACKQAGGLRCFANPGLAGQITDSGTALLVGEPGAVGHQGAAVSGQGCSAPERQAQGRNGISPRRKASSWMSRGACRASRRKPLTWIIQAMGLSASRLGSVQRGST